MRLSTKQHKASCGIALHARTLYICLLHHDGEVLGHQNCTARPATFLKVIAPSREDRVVAVAWLCTWYGRAALGTREGSAFVRGHARSRKALHGGPANHDRMAAQTIALLRREGLRPQASG